MNLEGKINVIKTAKDNIKSAIIAKGVVPSGNISTYASAISGIDTTNNTNLTINPSTTAQTFTVSGQYTGYETVKVNGVTANIDSDIQAGNIKSGVNILGITGNVVELQGEVKTETLSSVNGNTYVPSSGANGITSIKVNPKNMDLTITPSTTEVIRTVPSGYSGHGNVTVEAVDASIDSNIKAENIKYGINILDVTGTFEGGEKYGATMSTFLGNVDNNGVLQRPTYATKLVFGNVKDIGSGVLEYFNCNDDRHIAPKSLFNIKTISFPNLVNLSGSYAMNQSFYGCTELTNVDLSSLVTVSGSNAMSDAFNGCTGLTSLDLSSLTTVSGNKAVRGVFTGCTGLTSVDLSSLTTISGSGAMSFAFQNCTGLTSVDLSSLTTITGSSAMNSIFYGCTGLKALSFPSLTSASFGSYTNQFDNMLLQAIGCTVHFPKKLQSIIGNWSSVTSGFGGTNTTVLFDLPATT